MKNMVVFCVSAVLGILSQQIFSGTDISSSSGVITITKSTYSNDIYTRTCDATPAVSHLCNNQKECNIQVTNAPCGDPAPTFLKQLTTYYKCDGHSFTDIAKEYTTTNLTCDFKNVKGKKGI